MWKPVLKRMKNMISRSGAKSISGPVTFRHARKQPCGPDVLEMGPEIKLETSHLSLLQATTPFTK